MYLEELSYELPSSFIAQIPAARRDTCRLLVLKRKTAEVIHAQFSEIGKYLSPPQEYLLVLNDSRVFKARLFAQTDKGKLEVFIVEKVGARRFEALLRPQRRVRNNLILVFRDGTRARVVNSINNLIEFEKEMGWEDFERVGTMPLPPYIRREVNKNDEVCYQTVYSKKPGSLAASTAGLHFSPSLLRNLREEGLETVFLTLHISYGTFRPIRSEILEKHPMLAEYFYLSPLAAEKINEARRRGKRVVAVGTSAVRALESSVDFSGKVVPFEGFTELFIYPGYKFKVVEGMVTNFHLPCSTPLALVSALAGRKIILSAYQEAIKADYRFYSYGDAMLIL